MLKALHAGTRYSGELPSNNNDYHPCVGGLVSDDGNGYGGGEATINVWEGDGNGAVLEVRANDNAIVLQLDGVDVAELLATLQRICRPEWMDAYEKAKDQETAEIAAIFEKVREVHS